MTKTLFFGRCAWNHLRGSLWDRYLIGNELRHIFYDDTDIRWFAQLVGSSEIGDFEVDIWPSWLTVYTTNWAAKYLTTALWLGVILSTEQPSVTFKVTYLRAPLELGDPPNITINVKYMSELISDEIPASKSPTQMIPPTMSCLQGFRDPSRVSTAGSSYFCKAYITSFLYNLWRVCAFSWKHH